MDINLIYGSEAALADLYILNSLGIEFIVQDGKITDAAGGLQRGKVEHQNE